jgi:hypothetical protein
MVAARTRVVIPRRRCEAAEVRIQRRLATALWRYLSELAALPDRSATFDDLPPEFFRFPPF